MQLKYTVTGAAMAQCARLQFGFIRWTLTIGLTFFALTFGINLMEDGLPSSAAGFGRSLILYLLGGLAFGAAFSLAQLLLLQPFKMWLLQRQNPLLFGEMELTTDEQGIEFKSPRSTARYHWSDLPGFKENGKIFLICLSKTAGYPIPKQGMSPEFMQELRAHWSENLKLLR